MGSPNLSWSFYDNFSDESNKLTLPDLLHTKLWSAYFTWIFKE